MKRIIVFLTMGLCVLTFALRVGGGEPGGQQADDPCLLNTKNRLLKSTNKTLRAEIAKLKAENIRLRAMLQQIGVDPDKPPAAGKPSSDNNRKSPITTPATRPAIGVSVVDVTAEWLENMRANGIPRPPRKGALVARVSHESPAHNAGLKTLDIIIRIDVDRVEGTKTFSNACRNVLKVNRKCAIQILRIAPLPRGKGHRWVSKRLVVIPAPWAEVKAAGATCPIRLIGAVIRANVIGQPEAWLSVRNVSAQNVVAFEVTIDCFDRFDRPISGFIRKSNRAGGISQVTIAPGKKDTGYWTLHGRDITAKVVVTLLRVKLADGQEWTPKEGEIVSIKGESAK